LVSLDIAKPTRLASKDVDHGKTTLTAALSGKWTDTHSEELKRGITIKLGYADATLSYCEKCKQYLCGEKCKCKGKAKILRKISFVDAPGHETLMAIMISGAAIMDGAMLLVAANEQCPQPQTREHLEALKILGIKNIIIIQNKVDLVSKTDAQKSYEQISKFVKKTLGFEAPIIPISAQKKVNIDLVIEAMQEFLATPKRGKGHPEFLIARSFDINKPGTEIEKLLGGVIGGAITSGEFKVGDKLEIKPGIKIKDIYQPIETKIDSIVCGKTLINKKGPGGSIAISTALDPSIAKKDALVGNVAGLKGNLPPVHNNLELEMHLFEKVLGVKEDIAIAGLKMNEPLMISIATATTLGIVNQAGKKAKLSLRRPVCAHKGSKVALSRQIKNRWHLIGFGIIL